MRPHSHSITRDFEFLAAINHTLMKPILGSFVCSAAAALLLAANSASAQIYTEVGDAGQTTGTAQASAISQNGTIFGSLSSINDADVFRLTITNTATIMFSTVNALTGASGGAGGLDTQLFLFTSTGLPVVGNDDANGFTLQSTLPAGNSYFASLSAGTYYIAISLSGNDPVNSVNQLLFMASADPTSLRGPASGVNPQTLNGFDSAASNGPFGSYQIDVGVVPEPSTWALCGLGVSFLLLLTTRRRRAVAVRK